MTTLILYASKYGAAKIIAGRIADKMGDVTICDIKQSKIPPISSFDRVIIGSSLYAGSIRREAKDFIAKNADELSGKTLGLFLSCFAQNDDDFERNFPSELLQAAKVKAALGGVFDPKKANAIERLIVKAVMKQAGYLERIDDNAISQFVSDLRN